MLLIRVCFLIHIEIAKNEYFGIGIIFRKVLKYNRHVKRLKVD